jgi:NAD(P)H-hydrate epimerase
MVISEIKKWEVKTLYPLPKKDSHKGENGRVMVVGGSRMYYGAPILSAMGALFGGADLVTLWVPECNFEISRTYYPDFIVRAFHGDFLDARSVEVLTLASASQGCIVLGPGIGDQPETRTAVTALAKKAKCPIVLDAEAIYGLPKQEQRRNLSVLITPHVQEFSNWCGQRFPLLLDEKIDLVKTMAIRHRVSILLKSPSDIVASGQGEVSLNVTGNAGMTVGGTGDVLSGLVGSLIARKLSLYDAARVGVFIACTAGDELFMEKGYHYTGTDLALHLPVTIQRLLS